MHDGIHGTALSSSLVFANESTAFLAGTTVLPEPTLPLGIGLALRWDAPTDITSLEEAGVMTIETEESFEQLTYWLRPLEPISPAGLDLTASAALAAAGVTTDDPHITASLQALRQYRLWQCSLTSADPLIDYRVFVIEDPIPLIIAATIAGGAAGLGWLARRHARQDKTGSEIIRERVDTAVKEGRSVDVEEESESEVRLGPLHVKAKTTIRTRIGARPAV